MCTRRSCEPSSSGSLEMSMPRSVKSSKALCPTRSALFLQLLNGLSTPADEHPNELVRYSQGASLIGITGL